MSSRATRIQPVPVDSVATLPDGWYDVYRWLRRLTPSVDIAEELTVEVCRRMRSGHPAWLSDKAVDIRLRFFVLKVMLERRGLISDGVARSVERSRVPNAASAEALHVPYPMVAARVVRERPVAHDERAGQMVGARVAEILASLAAHGPAESWPAQLVTDCQAATQMSGVGLAVMGPDGPAAVLAATRGHAQQMEDLQFALGEGPCVDASRSGRPVLIADLTAHAARRWPVFAPEAAGAGVHAAFTFPLHVGAIGIGVLDLYRTARGELKDSHLSQALAFADAAVAVLLHLQDRAGPTVGGHAADGLPATQTAESRNGVLRAVDRRAVVHQATGMLSAQLGVSLAVALSRLRGYAYAAGRPILEVAADVVNRRLEFDDSDTGTALTPPRQHPSTTGEEESS